MLAYVFVRAILTKLQSQRILASFLYQGNSVIFVSEDILVWIVLCDIFQCLNVILE